MTSLFYEFDSLNSSESRGKFETIKSLKPRVNHFRIRGVTIALVRRDNGFKMIEEEMRPTHVEIVVRGDDIGDIERCV